ncbi:hypothetical protein [Ralstonia solanacearum]|uniref:hypothetical protein n=1 Tax=Ralstonia solanacearum TaxID=305 RepID=UPI001E28863A|nr:hypothetical protein [Ralstonia solanacearum]
MVVGEILPQRGRRQMAFCRAAGIEQVVDHRLHLPAHDALVDHVIAAGVALARKAQSHADRMIVLQPEQRRVDGDTEPGCERGFTRFRARHVADHDTPAHLPGKLALTADEDLSAMGRRADREHGGARHGCLHIDDGLHQHLGRRCRGHRHIDRQRPCVDTQCAAIGEGHGVAAVVLDHKVLQEGSHAVGCHVGGHILAGIEDIAGTAHGTGEHRFLAIHRPLRHGGVVAPVLQRRVR